MTNRLFESMQLGPTRLDNRIGVAPMTRTSATDEGLATDPMVSYYTQFARGGFALIITEGTYPDHKYSQGYWNQPGICNEEQMQAWKRVVDSVHREGGKIFIQLMHAGALSQGNRFKNETLAPSSVQPKGEQMEMYGGNGPFPMPREATKEDIQDVIIGFTEAAKRAKKARFDGIEIHGANGYLLDQFLTDYTNQRNDEYGGPTENRVRLLVEVSQHVRGAVGHNMTVGIRISQGKVNDFQHQWEGKEKDAKVIFHQLAEAGLDYIHVTEYEAWQPAFDYKDEHQGAWEPAFGDQGASLAALAKKYGEIPVMANGSLHDPVKAREMIEQGEADVVTIGRGALANSDWPRKVKNNETLNEFHPERFLSPNAKLKDFEIDFGNSHMR
ncbi:2,4-dienoyl-CoA reductase-like NADH-dependent reductase (Old Yellow Enzyme family) [Melghirimyces profundicolus]|uniref:2,4-dienoyl-CoA reductase-like NADH-dependent reductase (Old Yellow Enzyme family) n=2 Tax=Melghirimyces profundicolus TaxID=1242148 RepID=A0A2T6C4Q2_9BACL|nr:2,4-dienoyl-CoA reductase-like NADH-dependent reductase (Old Yellow Enzyme family) [Melghirimyces profundicolus]